MDASYIGFRIKHMYIVYVGSTAWENYGYQCFLLTLLEPELKDYGFIRLTIDAAIYPVYIIITVDRYLHVTMYSQPSLALADISI